MQFTVVQTQTGDRGSSRHCKATEAFTLSTGVKWEGGQNALSILILLLRLLVTLNLAILFLRFFILEPALLLRWVLIPLQVLFFPSDKIHHSDPTFILLR